ncbi:M10 family metallopeptidase C-terminal domain-containing protein [Phaeobacter italicus]|nr:M10 family metallopeptidase C-terminal domain-containing protein [Phaeobacter italicus]
MALSPHEFPLTIDVHAANPKGLMANLQSLCEAQSLICKSAHSCANPAQTRADHGQGAGLLDVLPGVIVSPGTTNGNGTPPMLQPSQIIQAMQFDSFYNSDPLNTANAPRLTITYQFADTTEPADLPTNTTFYDWQTFTAAERENFREAFAHIETFLNVDFVEVNGQSDPDLNLGLVSIPGSTVGIGGYSIGYRGTTITRWDGFAVFDNQQDMSRDDRESLILHEIGHAMGLQHSFEANPALPAEFENNLYTVMSYSPNPINGLDSDAMMLFDVIALQDIWGAAQYNSGNTTYSGARTDTVDLIWDTGGVDTFDASDRSSGVRLDLRQMAFSSFDADSDVVIGHGVTIENAIGGLGRDRLTGNGSNNQLTGGRGRDTLLGETGNDSLVGNGGVDILKGGSGRDTLKGGYGNDRLFGNSGNDLLLGGPGRDTLNGQLGNDQMQGMGGADTFKFFGNSGNDTIRDFQDDIDTLHIRGHGTADQVLARASEVGNDVVFDFDGNHSLTLRNVTLDQISDDLLV